MDNEKQLGFLSGGTGISGREKKGSGILDTLAGSSTMAPQRPLAGVTRSTGRNDYDYSQFGNAVQNITFPKGKQARGHFHELSERAAKRYGVAQTRPQELDNQLVKQVRKTNLKLTEPPPKGYYQILQDWAEKASPPTSMDFPSVMQKHNITWVGKYLDYSRMSNLLFPYHKVTKVVALDFEFNIKQSMDGFIAVASCYSEGVPDKMFVMDAIYGNESHLEHFLNRILPNPNIVTIFCDISQDVSRVIKDFGIYPVGLVDVQHLFDYHKKNNFEVCLTECSMAIGGYLKKKNKPFGNAERRMWLQRDCQKAGLKFLAKLYLPESMKINEPDLLRVADWTARPLNPELQFYAGLDAYLTYAVFFTLLEKVGHDGYRYAVLKTQHDLGALGIPEVRGSKAKQALDPLMASLQSWRIEQATHVDLSADEYFPQHKLEKLHERLRGRADASPQELVQMLTKLGLSTDDISHAARRMEKHIKGNVNPASRCHACGRTGHSSKQCPFNLGKQGTEQWKCTDEAVPILKQGMIKRWHQYCVRHNLPLNTPIHPNWVNNAKRKTEERKREKMLMQEREESERQRQEEARLSKKYAPPSLGTFQPSTVAGTSQGVRPAGLSDSDSDSSDFDAYFLPREDDTP